MSRYFIEIIRQKVRYFLKSLGVYSFHPAPIASSSVFWENEYALGHNSGPGSYGQLAEYKAEFIKRLTEKNQVVSVIDAGCGDGNQLSLMNFREYVGIDVSKTTITRLREKYRGDSNKQFYLFIDFIPRKVDLVMSLDVIYHLIEDPVFENYMKNLFDWSKRFVVIYSSNYDDKKWGGHFRHREFSKWIKSNIMDFKMIYHEQHPYFAQKGELDNTTTAEFYVYERVDTSLERENA